ncbi:MAG: NUDIX hydrolase [Candidatus Hydrogenedentota bacterium]|nr:MAG: NUDIX hydrolase [Candidatus Hydrogenedentota bacterium]
MMEVLHESKSGIRFVLKNGKPLVEYPEAAGIIAIEDEKLIMVRQFRNGCSCETLEIPAGKKDPSESLLQCAHRELYEETGYKAKGMKKLFSYYPAIGISTEKLTLFLAKDVYYVNEGNDPDKDISKVEKISLSMLEKMLHKNEIIDSKTLLAVQYLLLNGF